MVVLHSNKKRKSLKSKKRCWYGMSKINNKQGREDIKVKVNIQS